MKITKRLLVLLITVSMLLSGSFVQAFAEGETVDSASVAVPETVSEEDPEVTEEAAEAADATEAAEPEVEEVEVEVVEEAAPAEEETPASVEETQETPEPTESENQENKSEEAADNDDTEAFTSGKLTFECDEYTVTLEYGKKAGIPEGTVLDVREILKDSEDTKERKEYQEYYETSLGQLQSEKGEDAVEELSFARFYDITLINEGKEIEPEDDVTVTFNYNKGSREFVDDSSDAVSVVHLTESGRTGELEAELIDEKDTDLTLDEKELKEVGFTTDSFSVYGIVEITTLEGVIKASDGKSYKITVSFDDNAGVPAGSELKVDEIPDEDYEEYLTSAAEAVGTDIHRIAYGKLFDISIVKDGKEYQPDDSVKVTVELLDAKKVDDVKVVHFDDKESAQELSADTDGTTVTFETEGFSVFSFMDFSLLERMINAAPEEKKGTLFENDDIILSGSMPALGIVEAKRVEPEIEGVDVLVAYDIKIYANSFMKLLGITWQPSGESIKVTMKSDALKEKKVDVYHMADASSSPELVSDSAAVKNNSVTFDAKSFSVYALTPETYHRTYRFFTYDENMQYVEYLLYTDSGTTTYTQIIKDGEELVVPQLPSIPGSNTSTFSGWYEGTLSSGSVDNQPIDPANVTLSSDEFDFDSIPPITEDGEEVYLFARFADFAYVIFHDQYNGSINDGRGGFPVALTRRGEKTGDPATATVEISDFTVAYDDDSSENAAPAMSFYGWSYTPIKTPGSTTDDEGFPVSRISTDSISITETVHLYPIFVPIHWLKYYSGPIGSGATYIPSSYQYEGDGPESLAVPVRSGYTFAGWYTGGMDGSGNITYTTQITNPDGSLRLGASDTNNGVSVSGGKLLLSKDATIYAKWEKASVNYTVVIWRQKSTDAANLANNNKSYDYAESFVLSATTDSTVSVGNTYKGFSGRGDYVGFTYNRCDSSKTVEGDGSTVLNVYYDRNVHTLTFLPATGNSTIRTITELYGHNISEYFPIVGTNGTTYTAERWKPQTNTVGWSEVMTAIQTMPDGNVTFRRDNPNSPYPIKTIYYYVEALPEDTGAIRRYNGKDFVQYGNPVEARYNAVSSEDFIDITGFDKYGWTDANGNSNPYSNSFYIYSTTQNQSIYFYYTRTDYDISFLDSYTNTYAYIGGTGAENKLDEINIGYSESINNYVPNDPTPVEIAGSVVNDRNGYEFTGWYTDPACSTRVFFEDNAEYQNYSKSKVLWDKMPANNLRVYAGWETIWYKIIIDPNYGWLRSPDQGNEHGTTWFWEPYNGDPVQEYTWVTRDYVESNDGTFFYHYDDRSAHGWPDEWSSEEDSDQERYAYYTSNQGEATDHTRTFKYAENAYRYAGWYEVDPETGEETLYNFDEPVTHDTYLVLHWKKIGTYHVRYNAVVTQDGETISGSIDGGDSNETLFAELDGDHYADNATVVASRTVDAPAGYNFVGWKIRGDNSGTIYYPGQSFTMLSKYTVTMPEGETIFLDAVYSRVGTAKIIYDVNGGDITSAGLDYGTPTDSSAAPSTSCDTEAGTATIENLINNSEIRLSNGDGFSMEGAELAGWNTKPDASGEHFDLDTNYFVDTEEPVTLYAEWKVKVYFHRNKDESAWGNTDNWSEYTAYGDSGDVYYTTVYLNTKVDAPTDIPVTTANPTDNLYFNYWGTQRYGDASLIDAYDFDTPVTDELHLYAFWAGPIELPIHVLDSSNETISQKDSWRRVGKINVYPGDSFTFSESDIAENYVNVPDGYEYAFTAIHNSTDSIQNISEDDIITQVYYNAIERVLYVKYADTSKADAPLANTDEVYFVYYQQKPLDIGYKLVSSDGSFTSKHDDTSTGNLGSYNMQSRITNPLNLAGYTSGGSTYYAYALGNSTATNSSGLQIITSTSNRDNSRPTLQVRNTWRGFEYTTDGANWVKCGYDGLKLYVVYFESQPTIVTLNEKTIGPEADMDEEFEYVAIVTETTTTTITTQEQYRSWGSWYDNGNPTSSSTTSAPIEIQNNTSEPYLLSDGKSQSITLFSTNTAGGEEYSNTWSSGRTTYRNKYTTTVTTTQTIILVQKAKSGFTTEITESSDGTVTQNTRTWTYSTSADSEDQSVTYTNTRTPLAVEVHLAIVNGESIALSDNNRKQSASPYTIELGLGDSKTFLNEISASDMYEADGYGFAGVYYGTDDGNDVSLTALAESITYGQMDPPDGNIYELYLDGDTTAKLSDNNIYYLFYPLPHVQYMKEGAGGALTKIVTDDQHPLNSGNNITLNGTTVTQNQMLPVGPGVFTVTQDNTGTASNNYFNMPLVLDDTTESPAVQSYLRYTKLGVGASDAANTSELNIMDVKAVQLKLDNGQVKWSQDGTTWNSFSGVPTVYAIYSEIGHELRIRKTVTGDGADPSRVFALTISSDAITKNSYAVSGTGYTTVEATPASGSRPGTIVLAIQHGSDIRISGLSRGDYTLTESAGAVLTAKIGDETQDVHFNSVDIALNSDTEISLFNEMRIPAPTEVTLRLLPFILMLIAGEVLILLKKVGLRRRKTENEGGQDD